MNCGPPLIAMYCWPSSSKVTVSTEPAGPGPAVAVVGDVGDLRVREDRHVELGGFEPLRVEPEVGRDLGHRSAPVSGVGSSSPYRPRARRIHRFRRIRAPLEPRCGAVSRGGPLGAFRPEGLPALWLSVAAPPTGATWPNVGRTLDEVFTRSHRDRQPPNVRSCRPGRASRRSPASSVPNTSSVWMNRWRPIDWAQVKPSSTICAAVNTPASSR